jgi:hypothetical protein
MDVTDKPVSQEGYPPQAGESPPAEDGDLVVMLGKGEATRVFHPEQFRQRLVAFWKGMACGLAAGIVVGAVGLFLIPWKGLSAPPAPAGPDVKAGAEIDRLTARVKELEQIDIQQAGARQVDMARQKARLAELEKLVQQAGAQQEEIVRQKARIAELEAFNARLADTVKVVRETLKEVDIQKERQRLLAPPAPSRP